MYPNVLKYWDTLKIINVPFVPNGKFIILSCPKIGANYSLIIICSKIGTPNNHHFPFGTNGNVVVLGVPILKHFRVFMHTSVVIMPLCKVLVYWLIVMGLTALCDGISVYIEPSAKEKEKERRNDRRE